MLAHRLLTAATRFQAAKLLTARKPLGAIPVRNRWAFGEDARGPEIAVGAKGGNQQNPELHTEDYAYNGTPSKGDIPLPEWTYRTSTMGRTYLDRMISLVISSIMWAWFSYHMYYHSGMLFGHWYMPYLSEFTDEELGIPPDDAPDPEYWGHHTEEYGTYR